VVVHGNGFDAGPGYGAPGDLLPVGGHEGTEHVGLAQGWGRTFRGRAGGRAEFLVAVPTPGEHLLERLLLSFRADPGVVVVDVVASGGGRSLADADAGDGVNLRDDGTGPFVAFGRANTIDLRAAGARPLPTHGLAVLVRVTFEREGTITFHAAGADFEPDE